MLHRIYTEPKTKGSLVFLQELGVALQEEWQKIPRAAIHRVTDVVHEFLQVEVPPDIDLDYITFIFLGKNENTSK